MNLTRALGSIGGLTLASRILGLVRDSLFARYVGAGAASDAFLIAFRLPNMFRALFAEGAFSAAFVPMFSRKVAEGDTADGIAFAEAALAVLLPILIVMTVAMEIFAVPVVWALTFGFGDSSEGQFAAAVEFSRITFPYLLCISLVSLLGGILNSLQRYWVNAAAPILLNIVLIAALVFFHTPGDPIATARIQAIGVSIAGVLQLVWLILACRAANVVLRLRLPRLSPDVKRLLKLIVPAAAGAGAVQFNLVVSTALAASLLPAGAVSYIYYADRLNQLPLGLIGIGLGTVLLPTISRLLGKGDDAAAIETQNRGTELALFLTLPATVALVACGTPIVAALFQHGEFTAADTVQCARALAAFSLGLPAYILVKVLTPGFYARHDTRTPVRFATWSIAVNLVLNLALIMPLQQVGPPLATAIAAWVNVALLYRALRTRGHFLPDAQLVRRTIRLALAALVMGAAVWFATDALAPYTTGDRVERTGAMIALVSSGGLVYLAAAFALRAYRLSDLKALVRRPPAA